MILKTPESFRLAHLSDIHFNCLTFNVFRCFNKRAKGLLRKIFCNLKFEDEFVSSKLPDALKRLEVDLVCITGDLTLTALPKEFLKARELGDTIENLGIPLDVVPGNHDVYTSWDFNKKTFYKYFPNSELQNKKIASRRLSDSWWLVSLDCSCKNSWCSANGMVTPEQISILENFLFSIPESEHILISNHYPLLPAKKSSRDLINGKLLRESLRKFPNVKLYLHGHDHHACLYEFKDGTPNLIVNSGSTSLKSNSQFNLIDLSKAGCRVINIPLNILNFEEQTVPEKSIYELNF